MGAMTSTASIPPGPSRRRAGGLLLTYGIVGVLLLGSLFAATVAVAWMGRDGFAWVDATSDEVVTFMDSTSAALDQAATTLVGVGVSLTETAGVLDGTGALDGAATFAGFLSDGAGTLAEQVSGSASWARTPSQASSSRCATARRASLPSRSAWAQWPSRSRAQRGRIRRRSRPAWRCLRQPDSHPGPDRRHGHAVGGRVAGGHRRALDHRLAHGAGRGRDLGGRRWRAEDLTA